MKKHKRYKGQIKADRERNFQSMERSSADMSDFRRPAYAVKHAIRDQAEQLHETPAEYIARKYGIEK